MFSDNYYNNFMLNASPSINTPFLDSSSPIDTPFLDHLDATSEEFINMIFHQEPQIDDVYVASYLGAITHEPATAFNGDPSMLLIDKSQTMQQDTLFPPLMTQTFTPHEYVAPKKAAVRRDTMKAPKLYQCPFCDHKSKRRFNLNTHIKTHDKNRLKEFDCPVCPKRFDRKHDRDRHLVTVHTKNKHNPCHFCTQVFTRSDALQRHIMTKHDFCSL